MRWLFSLYAEVEYLNSNSPRPLQSIPSFYSFFINYTMSICDKPYCGSAVIHIQKTMSLHKMLGKDCGNFKIPVDGCTETQVQTTITHEYVHGMEDALLCFIATSGSYLATRHLRSSTSRTPTKRNKEVGNKSLWRWWVGPTISENRGMYKRSR